MDIYTRFSFHDSKEALTGLPELLALEVPQEEACMARVLWTGTDFGAVRAYKPAYK